MDIKRLGGLELTAEDRAFPRKNRTTRPGAGLRQIEPPSTLLADATSTCIDIIGKADAIDLEAKTEVQLLTVELPFKSGVCQKSPPVLADFSLWENE